MADQRLIGDQGTGLIASFAGVIVFLALLLFSVQILVGRYATTQVTAAALDGARMVAGSRTAASGTEAQLQARARAEARMRDDLGQFGRRAIIDWSGTDGDVVQVRIQADAPRFLFPGLQHDLGTDHLDRTVRVRVEAWR